MFRAMFSPIIRSTWLYLQYLVVFTQDAAGCPKHVELTWNNKLIYIRVVHVVGYLHNTQCTLIYISLAESTFVTI